MNIMKFTGTTLDVASKGISIADVAMDQFMSNQKIDHKIEQIEKLAELNKAMVKLGTDPSTVITTAQENITKLDEALKLLK